MPDKITKVMVYFDKNSFGLYLIHSPSVYIWFYFLHDINPYILSLLTLGIGAIISLILIALLRKLHLGILIGEKNNKNV